MYWNISTARQGAHLGIVGQFGQVGEEARCDIHFTLCHEQTRERRPKYILHLVVVMVVV